VSKSVFPDALTLSLSKGERSALRSRFDGLNVSAKGR
jgi:hypothetical protein